MAKRKKQRRPREKAATVAYTDPEGNVLTLRESLSAGDDRQARRGAGEPGGLGRRRLAAARGGAVRAARGQLGDRRPAARRPEDAARPLPDGRRRDAALGADDDRRPPAALHPRARRLSVGGSVARGGGAAHRRGARDPAERDRAADQPLLGAGRPARQRHRLAGRSGLRRRALAGARRGAAGAAAGAARARSSPPSPRTPAASRATASWRCSGWRRSSPPALRVPRRRRATKPTAASRARRLDAEAARRRAQAGAGQALGR